MRDTKTDKLIWYMMVTGMGIIIMGGGAWATSINNKVERIIGLEESVKNIRGDIADIKQSITSYLSDNYTHR